MQRDVESEFGEEAFRFILGLHRFEWGHATPGVFREVCERKRVAGASVRKCVNRWEIGILVRWSVFVAVEIRGKGYR
jgi:hypothetical protein